MSDVEGFVRTVVTSNIKVCECPMKCFHLIQQMVKGRCVSLSLVLRLVEGDSGGSEGAELEPLALLEGEAGGVEAVEPREEAEDRPLALLTPLVDTVSEMSGSGVDWTHFRLEGGGVRGGGDRESARLFMALVTRTGHGGR